METGESCTHCEKPAARVYRLPDGTQVPLCHRHYAPIAAWKRRADKAEKQAAGAEQGSGAMAAAERVA